MNFVTLNQISLEFSMPEQLIYLYELKGLPFTLVGNLKRYQMPKVKRWLINFNKKQIKLYGSMPVNYV